MPPTPITTPTTTCSTRPHGSLRPLGPWEQVFYYYGQAQPLPFCFAVELTPAPSHDQLSAALAATQAAHPLLRAHVQTTTDGSAHYVDGTNPIPVRHAPPGSSWTDTAARELTEPFPPGRSPYVRVTMLDHTDSATLVFTVDHSITDGAGTLLFVNDLVRSLNGVELTARDLPPAQEQLLDALPDTPPSNPHPAGDPVEAKAPAIEADPRLAELKTLRPFGDTAPHLSTAALSSADTDALVRACRQAGVSVHGALVAAATQTLQAAGRDFVRVVSPKDLRRAVGLHDDVALRLMPTRTAADRDAAADFWSLARNVKAEIDATRTVAGVKAMTAAVAANPALSPDDAVAGMLAGSSMDMMLTNLGSVQLDDTGPFRISDLHAPSIVVHMHDEQILSALTYQGRLRMTNTAHDPVPGLLDDVITRLTQAS